MRLRLTKALVNGYLFGAIIIGLLYVLYFFHSLFLWPESENPPPEIHSTWIPISLFAFFAFLVGKKKPLAISPLLFLLQLILMPVLATNKPCAEQLRLLPLEARIDAFDVGMLAFGLVYIVFNSWLICISIGEDSKNRNATSNDTSSSAKK